MVDSAIFPKGESSPLVGVCLVLATVRAGREYVTIYNVRSMSCDHAFVQCLVGSVPSNSEISVPSPGFGCRPWAAVRTKSCFWTDNPVRKFKRRCKSEGLRRLYGEMQGHYGLQITQFTAALCFGDPTIPQTVQYLKCRSSPTQPPTSVASLPVRCIYCLEFCAHSVLSRWRKRSPYHHPSPQR